MRISRTFLLSILSLLVSIYSSAQMFKEVSSEVGLNYLYPGNDFQMAGGGLMVIDVNNDGWDDFFQSGGVFDSKLWINNRGKFVDGTSEFDLESLKGYFIQGAFCADYDNDGFQDFFIANYGTGIGRGDKHSPALLHNLNGERFELIKLDDILDPGDYASACWGDFNKDGFVDLYVTNYVSTMGELLDEDDEVIGYSPTCFENKLLLNINGKDFRECSVEYGLNDGGCGLAASFTDIDRDGDQDLLLLNDFGEWTGEGNKCFRNDFPLKSFTDISTQVGFDQNMYGMSIGQGDYDNDGDLDYYVTNIGRNYLFNNQKGVFQDEGKNLNLDITFMHDSVRGTSWSGLFFDYEFDGDLDLYIAKGNVATLVPKTSLSDPNRLFLNENGRYENATDSSGVADILSHRGAVIFDYDHDGDLDIVSSVVKLPWREFGRREQKLKLYENQAKAKNWIGIRLVGDGLVSRDAFGSSVLFEQKGRKMLQEVDGASGHASQSTRTIYFGLNDDRRLQKATVYWLNGERTDLKRLKNGFIYKVKLNGKIKKIRQ